MVSYYNPHHRRLGLRATRTCSWLGWSVSVALGAGCGPNPDEYPLLRPDAGYPTGSVEPSGPAVDNILEDANRMGTYFKEGLLRLRSEFPEMGDIRQVGLHIGIELVKDPEGKDSLDAETKRIRDEGIQRGAIFGLAGARGNVLKIKPSLIIKQEECDEVLRILRESIKAVLR